MELEIRVPHAGDLGTVMALAVEVVGAERAGPFVRSHVEGHHMFVAELEGEVMGVIACRTDWFQCTFVSLVAVSRQHRKRGVARALFRAVEQMSPGPRVFSSTEETNHVAIQMHTGLGFTASGHIDNLPQGYRELLFYKRLAP